MVAPSVLRSLAAYLRRSKVTLALLLTGGISFQLRRFSPGAGSLLLLLALAFSGSWKQLLLGGIAAVAAGLGIVGASGVLLGLAFLGCPRYQLLQLVARLSLSATASFWLTNGSWSRFFATSRRSHGSVAIEPVCFFLLCFFLPFSCPVRLPPTTDGPCAASTLLVVMLQLAGETLKRLVIRSVIMPACLPTPIKKMVFPDLVSFSRLSSSHLGIRAPGISPLSPASLTRNPRGSDLLPTPATASTECD